MKPRRDSADDLWARHSAEWRDSAQIVSQWREAALVDPQLLESQASGKWWSTVESLGVTLFVTREYEHLVIALSAASGRPQITYLPLPHPSGLAADRDRNLLYIASTRNPNQVYTLKPVRGLLDREDVKIRKPRVAPMFPVASAFYPGCLYLHDLALFDGVLHGNAVGQNAVVRLHADGGFDRVWWPKCIELDGRPRFGRNYIQLNSIAAGKNARGSFFSASSAEIGSRRPGQLNYPVDGRGVLFSGRTRQPVCDGLTRPHSARLAEGQVWIANSGYGQLGIARSEKFEVVCSLPGWTRGLCIVNGVAFVATSRVIPKFARYAPGLDSSKARCAVHAVCCRTGQILGSLNWPSGNQVFAIDWLPDSITSGLPFNARAARKRSEAKLFYSYSTE